MCVLQFLLKYIGPECFVSGSPAEGEALSRQCFRGAVTAVTTVTVHHTLSHPTAGGKPTLQVLNPGVEVKQQKPGMVSVLEFTSQWERGMLKGP